MYFKRFVKKFLKLTIYHKLTYAIDVVRTLKGVNTWMKLHLTTKRVECSIIHNIQPFSILAQIDYLSGFNSPKIVGINSAIVG